MVYPGCIGRAYIHHGIPGYIPPRVHRDTYTPRVHRDTYTPRVYTGYTPPRYTLVIHHLGIYWVWHT